MKIRNFTLFFRVTILQVVTPISFLKKVILVSFAGWVKRMKAYKAAQLQDMAKRGCEVCEIAM